MDRLNASIVVKILALLTVRERLCTARVCQSWRTADADELVLDDEKLYRGDDERKTVPLAAILMSLAKMFTRLSTVHFRLSPECFLGDHRITPSRNCLAEFFEACSRLSRVEVWFPERYEKFSAKLFNARTQAALGAHPLRVLRWSHVSLKEPAGLIELLQRLDPGSLLTLNLNDLTLADNRGKVSDAEMPGFRHLVDLDWWVEAPGTEATAIFASIGRFTSLRHLGLSAWSITDAHLAGFLPQLSSLRCLDLSGWYREHRHPRDHITTAGVRLVAECCPNLQVLLLNFVSVPKEGVKYCLEKCPIVELEVMAGFDESSSDPDDLRGYLTPEDLFEIATTGTTLRLFSFTLSALRPDSEEVCAGLGTHEVVVRTARHRARVLLVECVAGLLEAPFASLVASCGSESEALAIVHERSQSKALVRHSEVLAGRSGVGSGWEFMESLSEEEVAQIAVCPLPQDIRVCTDGRAYPYV